MQTYITNQGIVRLDENSLQHHGVLGMKWGVRRYQDYGEGGYNPKHKGKFKPAKKQKEPSLREKVQSMSDEELDKALQRKRKEQQYIELSSKEISGGKKILAAIGAATAAYILKPALQELGKDVVKKGKDKLPSFKDIAWKNVGK